MSLHAVGDVDDAVTATKELLLPFAWRRWFRFAVVALFLGGGAGLPTIGGQWTGETTGIDLSPAVPERVLLLVLLAVGVALLLGLALAAVGAMMEFVLFEALATRTLDIRGALGRHAGKGLRLFGFRALFWFAVVAPILAGVAAAVLFPPLFILALLLSPLLLLFFVLAGTANGFTTMFVVPIMLREDCGVLDGWRRLWPAVRANLAEFGAYAGIGFVLNVAAGFLVGVIAVVVGLLLAIPFLLVFGIPFVVLPLAGPLALVFAVVGGGLYALVMLAVIAYVQVPVQTFLRYYATFVLGDVAPSLDPIEDVRRAVRTDGGTVDVDLDFPGDDSTADSPEGDERTDASEPSDDRGDDSQESR